LLSSLSKSRRFRTSNSAWVNPAFYVSKDWLRVDFRLTAAGDGSPLRVYQCAATGYATDSQLSRHRRPHRCSYLNTSPGVHGAHHYHGDDSAFRVLRPGSVVSIIIDATVLKGRNPTAHHFGGSPLYLNPRLSPQSLYSWSLSAAPIWATCCCVLKPPSASTLLN
jgi:hypothetical protein